MISESLEFPYEQAATIVSLGNRIHDCVESISLRFDDYSRDHVRGPGLYFAIVSSGSVGGFAEPMGSNTWPTDVCSNVGEDLDTFYEASETVAHSRDGGVCIGVDGTILEQMVRFRNVSDDELATDVSLDNLNYADWMGARHMSAYETALRPEVIMTITLSEESGRITTFQHGEYETIPREEIGGPWRA
jgi:hypothetical protein